MSVTQQLFQLQEIDQQIETREKAVQQMTAELGESEVLRATRSKLAEEKKRYDALAAEQHTLDYEIDDLSAKLNQMEKDLYSGRIKIPKELSSLQQEIGLIKAKRTQIEDKTLAIMEEVESTRTLVAGLSDELKKVETEWQARQEELKQTIESETLALTELNQTRRDMMQQFDSDVIELYQAIQKRRGYAVAKVEQGICRGCRIALPANELQSVRSGRLIQCDSCGRILYLP